MLTVEAPRKESIVSWAVSSAFDYKIATAASKRITQSDGETLGLTQSRLLISRTRIQKQWESSKPVTDHIFINKHRLSVTWFRLYQCQTRTVSQLQSRPILSGPLQFPAPTIDPTGNYIIIDPHNWRIETPNSWHPDIWTTDNELLTILRRFTYPDNWPQTIT